MISHIGSILNEARTKLTRLGVSLFYLYLLLALAGVAGVFFGVVTLILKVAHIGASVDTPWWEVISLTLVSWFMMKMFVRESFSLIGIEGLQALRNVEDVVDQKQSLLHSKVIPFKRKSTW